jgi:Protein of unknown function (DUF2723)
MISRQKLEPLILVCAVAISRFAFRSHDLYDLDSVNFALAMERFDPRVHQPHPPGYFLYVCLGRLLNSIVHDANLALVVLSITASCGVVLIIYKMSLEWFGQSEARFASVLFLCSPLAWFHGTVALTYSVEAFFSALLGYLCWRIDRGNVSLIAPAGAILGVSAGVRPSSLLFLGPLYLFSLRNAKPNRKLIGVAALVLTLAAWIIPMISASGGFFAYFDALVSLWRLVPSKNTVFNSSPATSIARACTIVFIYLLSFGAASFASVRGLRHSDSADPKKRLFTIVWIVPTLCFFTFIFLQFVNSGYLLLLAAPSCIWLGLWASEWYRSLAWRRTFKLAAIGVCVAVNVLIFLASPFYCSYRSVRRFEAQLESIRTALPQLGAADEILVIGFDSHFLGYRHAGYYLPNYLTVEYPEVKLGEGARVFGMHGRNTRLLAELPIAAYSRFVFFPLPSADAAYGEYLEKVKRLLPDQSLRIDRSGGDDFVTGPSALLPLLFPSAAAATPGQSVYPLLHSKALDVNSRKHHVGEEIR